MTRTNSKTAKTNKHDQQRTFHNQIQPMMEKLERRCAHHGIPVLIAASVNVTKSTGLTAFSMSPRKDGTVPTEFITAREVLMPTYQTTVTEVLEAEKGPEAAEPESAST